MRISILQPAKTFFLNCLIPNYSEFFGFSRIFTSFFNFFYFSSVKSKHVTYFGKVNRTTFSRKRQNFVKKSQKFMLRERDFAKKSCHFGIESTKCITFQICYCYQSDVIQKGTTEVVTSSLL